MKLVGTTGLEPVTLLLVRQMLSQLSYAPKLARRIA